MVIKVGVPSKFWPSKPFKLVLRLEVPTELLGLRQCQLDFFRVDRNRNEIAFSLGAEIEFTHECNCELRLDEPPAAGLYMLASFKVQKELRATSNQQADQELEKIEVLDRSAEFRGAVFFFITTDERNLDPRHQARIFHRYQHDKRTKPHMLDGATEASPERMGFVLCYGALLHHQQDLEGISLIPYGKGLDYSSWLTSAQAFTEEAFGQAINRNDRHASDFAQETPTIAIVFHRVFAQSDDEALQYITGRTDDLLLVIGIEGQHRPTPFAAFLWDRTNYYGYFLHEWFTGNRVAPWDPNTLSKVVELCLPRMKSPRVRLILETYAGAMGENDLALKYFKHWALLEFLARDAVRSKRDTIVDTLGATILEDSGKPVFTVGAAAKVYKYLFDMGLGSMSGTYQDGDVTRKYRVDGPTAIDPEIDDEVFSMWAVIGALYEIRNQVAHTGTFVPDLHAPLGSRLRLASQLFDHQSQLLQRLFFSITDYQVKAEVQAVSI